MEKSDTHFTFSDQRIFDEFCNLACKYCEGFAPSEFSLRFDQERRIRMPLSWQQRVSEDPVLSEHMPQKPRVEDFFKLGGLATQEVERIVSYDILKLSGGEITLYDELVQYVAEVHDQYIAVQLLTNGLRLSSEQIDQFAAMGNVFFQISLDGVTKESNEGRTGNGQITQKILDNIVYILEKGIGVEINCVLTKDNTGFFDKMLKYFKGFPNLVIIPRPVRGEPKDTLNFTAEQLEAFKTAALDGYEEFRDILPPRVYLERLVKMMETEARQSPCYVPFFVLGMDNYGTVETCPCGGNLPKLGNVFKNPQEISQTFKKFENYSVINDYHDCSYCMVQYELINLYIEGAINRDEMLRIPSFQYPGVLENIDSTKDRLVENGVFMQPELTTS